MPPPPLGLTIQQLLTPQTRDQVRSTLVAILQGIGLQPQDWATGSIASSVLTGAAAVLAMLSTQLSNAIAQQWNPTATGGGLQLLSLYFYGVNPPQPTFATGNLQLTNTAGGIFSYAAGQFFVASTVRNANGDFPVYTNTAPFVLGAGSPGSPTVVTFPIQCVSVQGSQGNAAPGFVSNLVSTLQGVAATNPTAIVGNDALTDEALRQLNIDSLAVQSVYGPRGAYAYAIATATDLLTGLPVNVNRQSISIDSHTGDVTIVVASPSGGVPVSSLEGISNNIELLARPDGVTVLPGLPGFPSAPASAVTVAYSATIDAYVLAPQGVTQAQLQTAVENALTVFFEGPSNPIGGVTAPDDTTAAFTGIFESGVTGVIAQGVSTVTGCVLVSTRYSSMKDLALTSGQVAVDATNVTVHVLYRT